MYGIKYYFTSSCCLVCEAVVCHIYSFKANFNYFSVLKIELVKLFSLMESYRQLHVRFSHEIITDIPDESCQFPQTQSNCQCHPLPDQLSFVIRSHLVDQ